MSGAETESAIKPFKGQVWEQLKKAHNRKKLFEDPLFPATDESMYFSQAPPKNVEWRRPIEAIKNPQFVVNGFGRCDLDQGYLGNCWFIAGCIGIMQVKQCLAKVVPQDQGYGEDYAGIFHFRFWLYGEWVDVVIDDQLPFYPDGRLVFCSNRTQPNELWGALLEKAYAKLYGSYESLEGGFTTDALIDMSGGLEEVWEISTLSPAEKQKFWKVLFQAFNKHSMIACSINPDPRVKEAVQSNGLIKGHAYTVTDMIEFENNGKTRLIRIQNPWGDDREWTGAWSDKSKEWKSVSNEIKQKFNFVIDGDGEFWMSYNDFMANWDTVQLCHITADSYSDEVMEEDDDSDLCWKCVTYQSDWRAGSTAGGSGQPNQQTFWTNPQFMVTLKDVDANDKENMATVIVALMQKDSRLKRMETGDAGDSSEEHIQFRMYKIKDGIKVDENKTTGLRFYSNQLQPVGDSGSYINRRTISKRFRVPAGNYVIIPSTFDEDRNCRFLIRIFTEAPIDTGALNAHKSNLADADVKIKLSQTDKIKADVAKPVPPKEENRRKPTDQPKQPASKPKPTIVGEPEDACKIM